MYCVHSQTMWESQERRGVDVVKEFYGKLYFGHLMQRADSLEKTLMLGGIEGSRTRGRQRMRWLDGITDSMDMGLGDRKSVV